MSVTKDVENYIMQNSSIRSCLKHDIINFSSLSRKLIKELGLRNKDFDAVLIACRRLQRKLKADIQAEKKVQEILRSSSIELKTGIAVFIVEKGVYFDSLIDIQKRIKKEREEFHVIDGMNTTTIITTKGFSEDIRKLFRSSIIKENEDLAEIIIKTSKAIEKTPGVLSYLYSLLSDHGINIFETMSTWTDTLFIIDEKELEKAVKILKFK